MTFFHDTLPLICLLFSLAFWILSSKEGENVFLKGMLKKFIWYVEGILFMVTSKDSKGIGKKLENPDDIAKCTDVTSKRVIFIRHGESDWNEVFNKGFGPMIFVRLGKAMFREAKMYHTSDSVFLDSPLNTEGFEQALKLGKYVAHTANDDAPDQQIEHVRDMFSVLRGDTVDPRTGQPVLSSIIVTSQLRRAISTCVTGLWGRIAASGEKVHVLSALQEIALNVDTKALSEAKGLPDLSRITKYVSDFSSDYAPYFDVSENHGNKTNAFNGLKRLSNFANWVFTRQEDVIIASGHSLWFKYFFATYLSHSSTHKAKSTKIVNSGVVSFTLRRGYLDNRAVFSVEENSICELYGGFEQKKK